MILIINSIAEFMLKIKCVFLFQVIKLCVFGHCEHITHGESKQREEDSECTHKLRK